MGGWEETLGRVLVVGFGPDAIRGIIPMYFDRISAAECKKYICENISLLRSISDRQWSLARQVAQAGKITLSYDEVIKSLSEHRPDVLGTICTTEGGIDWLRRQVEEVKQKLAS